jgi:hypothetical protein
VFGITYGIFHQSTLQSRYDEKKVSESVRGGLYAVMVIRKGAGIAGDEMMFLVRMGSGLGGPRSS